MDRYSAGGEAVSGFEEPLRSSLVRPGGESSDRLVGVKSEWAPENLFRLNHNVESAE
ncbi:BBE domain-containing protein [Halapricum hydrolyticum]|uniref:BBE domain-containing protein n=2 Tax=Halapricum hydrolyticum TaxID=2979991 RepID=A0ABT2Q631_9EURY|nr:BBE domain-containing protein [Halapricum hydrolyticum]MCU4718630.1 BBE domain-containing protein [Halapricum hydrolyticum]